MHYPKSFLIFSYRDYESKVFGRILELEFSSPGIKTYKFSEFTPTNFNTDLQEKSEPIVVLIASSTLNYDRETNFVRRLRVSPTLRDDIRKAPVFFLAYENVTDIIKKYPPAVLLLSDSCTVVQFPFQINHFIHLINIATPIKSFENLREFLFLEDRISQIERLEKHRMANLLGPGRLLRGAYLSGEFGKHGKEVYENIRGILEQKPLSADFCSEYLDLREGFIPVSGVEIMGKRNHKTREELLSEKVRGLRILLIDDEHEMGWSDVIKELLIPNSQWQEQKDGIWIAKDEVTKAKFTCIAEVGKSQEPDDIDIIKNYLDLADSRKKWIDYDVILLDLRLKKESPKLPAKNTSGYLLLKSIRDFDPTIPVIMFTASEKAANMEALQKLGISGFFSKELPRGDDEFSIENFGKLKISIINAAEKSYLRDAWFIFVMLKEKLGRNKGFYIRLIEAAYFKIWEAHPLTSINKFNYNMAVMLFHQCLDQYTIELGGYPWDEMKKRIGELSRKAEIAKEPASYLNHLRNEIIHDGKIALEKEALLAFVCNAFILAGNNIQILTYSNDFLNILINFLDIFPAANVAVQPLRDYLGSKEDLKIIREVEKNFQNDVLKTRIKRSEGRIEVIVYTSNPAKVIGKKGIRIKEVGHRVQSSIGSEVNFIVREE